MSHTHTPSVLNRLTEIQDRIGNIYRMVESERSCPEVVMCMVAVQEELNRVAKLLLRDHAEHCIPDAVQKSDFYFEAVEFRKAVDSVMMTLPIKS